MAVFSEKSETPTKPSTEITSTSPNNSDVEESLAALLQNPLGIENVMCTYYRAKEFIAVSGAARGKELINRHSMGKPSCAALLFLVSRGFIDEVTTRIPLRSTVRELCNVDLENCIFVLGSRKA